jgi:hypothetical protein
MKLSGNAAHKSRFVNYNRKATGLIKGLNNEISSNETKTMRRLFLVSLLEISLSVILFLAIVLRSLLQIYQH